MLHFPLRLFAAAALFCALLATGLSYVIPEAFTVVFDAVPIRAMLATAIFFFIFLLATLTYWMVYEPSATRFYLGCSRAFLWMVIISGSALVFDLGLEQIGLRARDDALLFATFRKETVALFATFIASGIWLERFGRKYVHERHQVR